MTRRRIQLGEDRALRDTARAVLGANVEHLRGLFAVATNRERLTQRVTEEARELADGAGKVAGANKGALAFLIAAIVLWFGRDEILSLINRKDKADIGDPERHEPEEDAGVDEPQAEFEEAI